MKDKVFRKYPVKERYKVLDGILEEVRGRLLEEIVILETIKVSPAYKHVFKLQFAVGEFDMVIFDEKTVTCEIFEIKHTDRINPAQFRHLNDSEKCRMCEYEYGEITGRTVLYRGKDCEVEGVKYRNVTDYLEELGF